MDSRPRFGILVAVFAAAMAAVLVGLGQSGGTAQAGAPASDPAAATFEQSWMPQMMDHHATAIAMAQLCAGAGVRSELQQECDKAIANQTQDISDLQSWLMQWYGQSYTPTADMAMVQMLQGLTGPAFEKMFMEMMIQHHSLGNTMAQDALANAEHAEVKALAQKDINDQTAQIQQFQAWLQQWFSAQATPTASATATASATGTATVASPTSTARSATSTATTAPSAPSAGGGTAGSSGGSSLLLALGGAVALAGAAAAFAFSRSRA